MTLQTKDFDYHLPPELIAQHPSDRRDQSRMMVLHRATGQIEHRRFSDLPDYLAAGDLVVVNNTRVIPARIFGRKSKTGGKIEVLFLEELEPGLWDVLLRSRRRPKPGESFVLGRHDAPATLVEERELGRARIRIEPGVSVLDLLEEDGEMPLPPYIQRTHNPPAPGEEKEDKERYQTVYAKEKGSVAAPTAGLHFTPEVFSRLEAKGVGRAEVTLHVGIGTFRPVSAERVEDHKMDEERIHVPETAAAAITATRSKGGKVLCVGSTSVRTLEAVAHRHGEVVPFYGRTDLFIHEPFTFRATDRMLTNFHLPKSTLIMMVCALAGRELTFRAYEEAVRERYRFFSYGDCMLIL